MEGVDSVSKEGLLLGMHLKSPMILMIGSSKVSMDPVPRADFLIDIFLDVTNQAVRHD